MKKILIAIFVLISFVSQAQLYTPEMSRSFPYLKIDSGFALSVRDTNYTRGIKRPGLLTVRPQDSLLYMYTGLKWQKVAVDSTGLTALINLKVDSVKILTDTLFYYINGVGHGSVFSVSSAYPTSHAFDTATGIFTTNRNALSAITVDLDGRYDTSGHTHVALDITDFTSAGRSLLSAGSGISYNPTTGVIATSGSGTGTVTNFSKTDNYGITSSVTNPTTTPNHAIAVDTSVISSKSYANNLGALKLNISDTASMLANYKTKIEQHSDSLTKVVKLRDSTTIYYPRFSNPEQFLKTTNATSGNTVLTGGQVTWISGLTYYVSPTTYVINGVQYNFAGGNVTLSAADPSLDRQDAIILTSSQTATSITGVPDANPLVPTEDPVTQIFLTSGYIAAAATTPSNISQEIIRDEGAGGEATITKTLTSTDNYATNPYNGTISQRITAATNNQYVHWTKASGTWSKSAWINLIFFIRNNVAFNSNRNWIVQLFNGTTQVGVNLNLTTYGYSKIITGSYGTIAVPMSAFTGADVFNAVRLVNTGTGGTVDVQVDYIQLQAGVSNGGGASGTVKNVSVVSANGFAGTVANSTTTPAITLSTTVTGILKGDGTAISAATAGTDYVTGSSTNAFTNKSGNISQWTNDANYITLLSLSGLAPLLYNNTTGVISVDTTAGSPKLATQYFVNSRPISTFTNDAGYLTGLSANNGDTVIGGNIGQGGILIRNTLINTDNKILSYQGKWIYRVEMGDYDNYVDGTGSFQVDSTGVSMDILGQTTNRRVIMGASNGIGSNASSRVDYKTIKNLVLDGTGFSELNITRDSLSINNPRLYLRGQATGVGYVLTDVSGNGHLTLQAGASGSGTVSAGTANRLAYYPTSSTTVDDLAAITANRALISDVNGLPTHSAVTNTELGYVSGVISAIQTQIDSKQATLVSGTNIKTVNSTTLLGSGDLKTPKNLTTNYTDVGNIGAGVDDLMTYSIPAGQLATDGDYLEFTMTIIFAANANSKQVTVVYGGTTIYASGAAAQNDGTMEITGKIVRTGAATQRISFHQDNNTTLFTDYADYKTATETLSGAVTLKATGEGVANDDLVMKLLTVKYVPVN